MWKIRFRSPPPPTYMKSENSLAFLARAFADQKNHLSSLLLREQLLKLGCISCAWALLCLVAILMQCSCRVDLSWFLIPSNLKVVHRTTYDDWRCCSAPHRQWATNALHHWLLTSRSLALLCLLSLFYIPDLFSFFLCVAFLLEADCCLSRTAAATFF